MISLAHLADRLGLDIDEVRHGLACAIEQAGDIDVTPDPETAGPAQPMKILVDWDRFDAQRIEIRIDPA